MGMRFHFACTTWCALAFGLGLASQVKAQVPFSGETPFQVPAAKTPDKPSAQKPVTADKSNTSDGDGVAGTDQPPAKDPLASSPKDAKKVKQATFQTQELPQPGPEGAAPVPGTVEGMAPSQAGPGNTGTFSGFSNLQDAFTAFGPGNFLGTQYKWYGFVRLDGIYDFKPMGSTDSFVTGSIPVPQGHGQNGVLTPRYTRLGWDTSTPWTAMDWTIKTRIEVDFFNGNTSGVFGSYPLRIRFAWVDFGPFLVGLAPSLFMDFDVFPNVLDYQGPGGMVLMRQGIASVHFNCSENWKISLGVEQWYSDISWVEDGTFVVNPGSGIITTPHVARNVQDVPDFTGNIRYTNDYGHVQVAGIARKLTYQPAEGSAIDRLGYGINGTGSVKLWSLITGAGKPDDPTPLQRSRFLGQYAAGRGINRYFQDPNGLGLDASFDPVAGFRDIYSNGWFVAYEQWWAKNWLSNFTYGQQWNALPYFVPDNTFKASKYLAANLIWLPVERLGVGLEFLYGERENKDGQKGNNYRIQSAIQYRF
jgi:hypothetical protein